MGKSDGFGQNLENISEQFIRPDKKKAIKQNMHPCTTNLTHAQIIPKNDETNAFTNSETTRKLHEAASTTKWL